MLDLIGLVVGRGGGAFYMKSSLFQFGSPDYD